MDSDREVSWNWASWMGMGRWMAGQWKGDEDRARTAEIRRSVERGSVGEGGQRLEFHPSSVAALLRWGRANGAERSSG